MIIIYTQLAVASATSLAHCKTELSEIFTNCAVSPAVLFFYRRYCARRRSVRGENMCGRLQCEKDSIEVWERDVSLCQGYVAIWAALSTIRLKYKVL